MKYLRSHLFRIMSKQRLDILLVSRNLVESRELAQRLIIAGEVSVGGIPLPSPVSRLMKTRISPLETVPAMSAAAA